MSLGTMCHTACPRLSECNLVEARRRTLPVQT